MRILSRIVVAIVAAILAAVAHAKTADSPPIAFSARVVGDEQRARLILDFDRDVPAQVSLADDPMRLVVDVPRTLFRLPDEIVRPSATLVTKATHGLVGGGRSRLALELAEPAVIAFQTFREVEDGKRHRLIVDLRRDGRPEFEARLRRQALAEVAREPEPDSEPETAPPAPRGKRARIVIDPGHGGLDGGARGRRGTLEKRVTLQFSRALAERLRARGHEVLLTRTGDTFMSLAKRLAFMRDAKADLALSIHADSLRQRSIRGATVYTLSSRGSDALARSLARDQNRADLLAGIEPPKDEEAGDILLDLLRRETEGFSLVFAKTLVNRLREATRLIGNPHRAADFFVLRAPGLPSVLLELGYLSNAEDEKQLASKVWRERIADTVASAIDAHLKTRTGGQAIVCSGSRC